MCPRFTLEIRLWGTVRPFTRSRGPFHERRPKIYRGYYMAARRYEIYLRVLKNISRVSAANE